MISNGGTANSTIANALMHVFNGGIVNATILSSGGTLYAYDVCTANSTTINEFGDIYVASGGTANSTTVNYHGFMFIDYGGTANSNTLNGGSMVVSNGGTANSNTVNDEGYIHVYSGGTANSTNVKDGGIMTIYNGGKATGFLTIEEGAVVTVENGSILDFDISPLSPGNATFVNDLSLLQGTPSYTVTVSESQEAGVYSLAGGAAGLDDTITVMDTSGAQLGTIMIGNTYNYGNNQYILTLDGSNLNLWFNFFTGDLNDEKDIRPNMIASSINVNDGGVLNILSGGTAKTTTVNSGGSMTVSSGGTATGSLTIEKGAVVSACDGGVVEFNLTDAAPNNAPLVNDLSIVQGNPSYTIDASPSMAKGKYNLADGAYGFDKTVTFTGGMLRLDGIATEGGALYTLAEESGRLEFGAWTSMTPSQLGASYKDTLAIGGASCCVGAEISYSYGYHGNRISVLQVIYGGMAYMANVGYYGNMYVSSGGTAHTTTVGGGGTLIVSNGAKVVSTTVGNAGYIMLYGGTVKSTTVQNGGNIIAEGGKLTGTLTIAGGATVRVNNKTILDFDISALSPGNAALVNDLSRIQGTPTFTVTAKPGQAKGDYVLAGGAAEFNGTLTVKCAKAEDVSIAVGDTLIVDKDLTYSLAVNDGQLVLNVCDIVPPDAPSITLSGDARSQSAMLAAAWDADDAVCLYAVGGTVPMQEYAEPLTFSSDASVQFQTKDAAGNTTDRKMELMFGRADGVWGAGYRAWRVGMAETAELAGLNIIGNIVDGSDDATVLVLTDDANGDALFMDDIYNGVPHARLSKVNEIFAGAGNDVIDMTSPRFDYRDSGITVHGGDGNDVIWANSGNNLLFGDAGSDRLVGGGGDDTIVGGAGNDILHGGGGNDIFCFGGNWGKDVVEQDNGAVTLWFRNGDESKWDAAKRKYTDGKNTVTVKGNADVALKFGDDSSQQFKDLLATGAFDATTSDRLFGGMGAYIAAT